MTQGRHWAIALVVLVTLTLVGCGESDDDSDGDDADEPVIADEEARDQSRDEAPANDGNADEPVVLEAVDSGIEGVPIPESAEPDPNDAESLRVPGTTYLDLVAFYERELPEGQDHGPWAWCDTGGGDGMTADEDLHAHIYAQGNREILAVTVVNDEPPGILIGSDRSEPC